MPTIKIGRNLKRCPERVFRATTEYAMHDEDGQIASVVLCADCIDGTKMRIEFDRRDFEPRAFREFCERLAAFHVEDQGRR